jgi:glycosyltransferase involved in cell wall biosynthesis
MKIGIVAIHPFNGSLGTMEVISEVSKELSKMGVEIHVFTPFEDDTVFNNIFIHKISSTASQIGFERRFYSLMRRFYASPFIVKTLLLRKKTIESAASSLEKNLLPHLKNLGLDVLQGEQDIPSLACINLGKKLDVPVVAHIRNFWPEECVDIGLMKRDSSTYRVLHQLIGNIVEGADCVFTVSSYAKQFLKEEYEVGTEIVEIPRGARPFNDNIDYAHRLPSAVYSGSISRHENLPLFVRSMPFVQTKLNDCAFYITGKGDYKSTLEKLAKQNSVNMRFLWFQERTECQKFLSQCGVGIIPWANTVSRRFGFPIKMLNYFSVGLPVVMTDIGEWSKMVKKEKLGVVTEEDTQSFADGIVELLTNLKFAEECGKRGLKLINEKYNWQNSADIIFSEYNRLIADY